MGNEILIIHDTKLVSEPDWNHDRVTVYSDLKRRGGKHRWYHDQDHSRWVYEDVINRLIFKVWNHTYARRTNLLTALELDFYGDLIPAFQGVIKQRNICRGYVMKCCETPSKDEQAKLFKDKILPIIKKKTLETQLFAYDLQKENVLLYKGSPCLIDLEGVYPVQEYQKLKEEYSYLEINNGEKFVADEEYDEFIKGLQTSSV